MSGPAGRNLKQPITYWAPSDLSADNQAGFLSPIVIKGRWTENNQLVTTSSGSEITSKAVVFVACDVAETGFLALGDWTGEENPTYLPEASEIKAYHSTPDLRYLEQNRRAYV